MYIPLYELHTDKNNKKLVQMSCTAYIAYTFHLSIHHADFGQFKAKQVLLLIKKIRAEARYRPTDRKTLWCIGKLHFQI